MAELSLRVPKARNSISVRRALARLALSLVLFHLRISRKPVFDQLNYAFKDSIEAERYDEVLKIVETGECRSLSRFLDQAGKNQHVKSQQRKAETLVRPPFGPVSFRFG